ncbi:MAG: DUF2085 domain-containing protein [Chloroflexota bacterium]|nr:DUF2085 domain-containing protein [Chloroflexota bacterium]
MRVLAYGPQEVGSEMPLDPLIRFLLSGICHQASTHCLHFGGRPLPLCARCTGMFLGATLALFGLWGMGQGRRSRLPPWRLGLALAALASVWAVDGANSFLFTVERALALYRPSNILRLISGMGMGLALGVVLYPVYHVAFWRRVDERRVLDEAWRFSLLALAGILVVMGILCWRSAPYALWFWLITAAVFFVFSFVNACLVSLLWHRRGFAVRWWQVVPYFAMGLMLSLLEMSTMALLRRLLLV